MRTTRSLVAVAVVMLNDREARHFGYDIGKRSGVPSGVLYPLLSRMLAEGWIEDEWESTREVEQGRPPRRYYRITEHGLRELGSVLTRARRDARFPAVALRGAP